MLNETHDARLQSWVSGANDAGSDFPLQSLPFTVLRRRGSVAAPRVAVAIGDQALDLGHPAVAAALKLDAATAAALARPELNDFMALGAPAWSALRLALWPQVRWRRVLGLFPGQRSYRSHVPDPVLDRVADPGLAFAARAVSALRFFQSGQLPVYLLYILLTLVALLVWMVA